MENRLYQKTVRGGAGIGGPAIVVTQETNVRICWFIDSDGSSYILSYGGPKFSGVFERAVDFSRMSYEEIRKAALARHAAFLDGERSEQ